MWWRRSSFHFRLMCMSICFVKFVFFISFGLVFFFLGEWFCLIWLTGILLDWIVYLLLQLSCLLEWFCCVWGLFVLFLLWLFFIVMIMYLVIWGFSNLLCWLQFHIYGSNSRKDGTFFGLKHEHTVFLRTSCKLSPASKLQNTSDQRHKCSHWPHV